MEDGTPILHEMLDCIASALLEIDKSFAVNDVNTATRKTHECMLLVKSYKDCLNEPSNS